MLLTQLKTKRPAQAVRGPGMTGKKLPAIPRRIKKPERQIKKRSITPRLIQGTPLLIYDQNK